MRLFRTVPLTLLAVAAAGAAAAQTTPQASARADREADARGVLICKTDTASRRAFARAYGERPVFITAREALEVRRADPRWEAPRCMTEREHARYEQAANTVVRAR
jgi:hypothetical protein